MYKSKSELYSLVKHSISREDFEAEIKRRYIEFDELLNEQALAYLIVDEMGKNVVQINKISDLQDKMEATLYVIVTSILAIREFTRKNGSNGKVANLEISDNSSSCKLVLWDTKQIDLVENKTIKIDSKLKIVNAKVKKSRYGVEISISHTSLLIIEPEDFPPGLSDISMKQFTDLSNIKVEKNLNICGTILDKSTTRIFTKRDGSDGFVADMTLFDGSTNATVVIWGEKAKEVENFKAGDNIEILNCYVKERNGNLEINTSWNSKINKKISK